MILIIIVMLIIAEASDIGSMGWCFPEPGWADATRSCPKWSLIFRDAVAENAFVRSRHDKMMLNSRYVALFLVVCLLPDFVRYQT